MAGQRVVKLSFSVFTQPAIRSGRRHHCKFTLEDRAARREERERETVGCGLSMTLNLPHRYLSAILTTTIVHSLFVGQ